MPVFYKLFFDTKQISQMEKNCFYSCNHSDELSQS